MIRSPEITLQCRVPALFATCLDEVMSRLGFPPGLEQWQKLAGLFAKAPLLGYAHADRSDGGYRVAFPSLPSGWEWEDNALVLKTMSVLIGGPQVEGARGEPLRNTVTILVRGAPGEVLEELLRLVFLTAQPASWLNWMSVVAEDSQPQPSAPPQLPADEL